MNASTSSRASIATGTSISIDGGGGSGGRTSGRITSDAVTPTSSRNEAEEYLVAQKPPPPSLPGSSSSSLRATTTLWSDADVRDDDDDAPPPLPLSMSLLLGATGGLRLLTISCWMSSGGSFLGLKNMSENRSRSALGPVDGGLALCVRLLEVQGTHPHCTASS